MRWLSLAALLLLFGVNQAHAAGAADALCDLYKSKWDSVSGQTNIGSIEAVARTIPAQCPAHASALRRIDELKAKAREKAAAARAKAQTADKEVNDDEVATAPDIPTAPMPVLTTPPLQWSAPAASITASLTRPAAVAPARAVTLALNTLPPSPAAATPDIAPPSPPPAPVVETSPPAPAPAPRPTPTSIPNLSAAPPPADAAPVKPAPVAAPPVQISPAPEPTPEPVATAKPAPPAAPPPPAAVKPAPAVVKPPPAPPPQVIVAVESPKPTPIVAPPPPPPAAKPTPARRAHTKPAANAPESAATDPVALAERDETAGEAAYAAGNLTLADSLLNRALSEGMDTGDNHYWLGRLSTSQGKPRGAIAQFGLALEKTADDSGGDLRRIYFERAKAEYVVADYPSALADFIKFKSLADAANIDLGYDFYFDRGQTNLILGNDADAAADYTAALKLQPDDRAAHFGRGVSSARVSNFVGAISDLHDAVRLETQANALDFQTYYFLGIAEFLQGDKQNANADFTRAQKYDDGTMKYNVQCLMDDVQLPSLVMKMTRMGAACQKIDAKHELTRPLVLGPLAP